MCELESFADGLFLVDGPPVRAVGLTFPTRMILVKLGDGSLWVNSPVAAPREVMERITALGPIRHLVAPTRLHVWRLEEWHGLFPSAELWAPPQVPNQFMRLPFTGTLGDAAPQSWAADLDQLVFKGNLLIDEVFFLHRGSRTAILGDFIQNHRLTRGRPLFDTLLRLAGVAYPRGGVPIDIRLSCLKRDLARRSLERLLSWNFENLVIAHGVCIKKDGKAFVERSFRWLSG